MAGAPILLIWTQSAWLRSFPSAPMYGPDRPDESRHRPHRLQRPEPFGGEFPGGIVGGLLDLPEAVLFVDPVLRGERRPGEDHERHRRKSQDHRLPRFGMTPW